MEIIILSVIAVLLVGLILIFLQSKNLSTKQQSSSDQVTQLFTMFKSDVESAIKSASESTRANNETMAQTLQLVTNTLSKGMEENRTGTNSQVEQLAGQVSQLANIVGKQVENLRGSVEERLTNIGTQLGGQLSEANNLFSSLKQDFGQLKEIHSRSKRPQQVDQHFGSIVFAAGQIAERGGGVSQFRRGVGRGVVHVQADADHVPPVGQHFDENARPACGSSASTSFGQRIPTSCDKCTSHFRHNAIPP